jgi:hypothetical protein
MRRVLVIAALSSLALGVAAQAETWKGYSAVSATNVQWSYDADYSYRDAVSKRVVVLTAVGKVGATPRMGPSAPGAADGVGQVWALDCKAANTILVAGYSPSKPLAIPANWRTATPKKITSEDDKALVKAVCSDTTKLANK